MICSEIFTCLVTFLSANEMKLSWLSNIATIAGLIFAIRVYLLWKHDYRLQVSHEYALSLLKKIKYLHLEIESIRSPKFHHKETVSKEIKEKLIPQIQENILKKLLDIQVELLVAKQSLATHKDLQSKFNENIMMGVITPIKIAVYEFFSQPNENYSDVKNTSLWKILFPVESKLPRKIKQSILGVPMETIDDDFNQVIEDKFSEIYKDLEDNLAA